MPTPLSLADLADDDAPLPASLPLPAPAQPAGLSFEVEDATGKPELDPSAGPDMAIISEETRRPR
ncbi:hypothetical protein [Hymenobacter lapidiphilus]|uniref:hypothetical protein n=1 Tax=Hymenobacter sp. CCM 8763 TaxID=2303334 RepID=UPI0011C10314|nr:hypothetical protein [Hymenobacter sp. CCM 8763]